MSWSARFSVNSLLFTDRRPVSLCLQTRGQAPPLYRPQTRCSNTHLPPFLRLPPLLGATADHVSVRTRSATATRSGGKNWNRERRASGTWAICWQYWEISPFSRSLPDILGELVSMMIYDWDLSLQPEPTLIMVQQSRIVIRWYDHYCGSTCCDTMTDT